VLPSFHQGYERGKRRLESMGFTLKEGQTIALQKWYAAGTPEQQAADINAMFDNPKIKALIATSGGNSAISVLEHLDYDVIKQHPKPFIGMSDMTAYHLALYAKTGLAGFHMDDVIFGLGGNRPGSTFDDAPTLAQAYIDALTSDKPMGALPHKNVWETWRDGVAEGQLIGGNLNSIGRQIGTPYFPKTSDFDGAILFWESVGQPAYQIARSLYQLKYAGILKRIGGMVVGTITDMPAADTEMDIPSVKDVVLEVTKAYNFPIMANLDFGHYTVNLPMIIGLEAKIDTKSQSLHLLEGAVI
jgi:muramoyltetrapeptide carboxypeptidase